MKQLPLLPLLGLLVYSGSAHADKATLTVDASKPGARISPTLYGAFFEEINRAGDGGIYAEMVQNRSFEDAPMPLGWTLLKSEGSGVSWALDKTLPLNPRNSTSLRLDIPQNSGRVGISSEGFKGAPWGKDYDEAKAGEWASKFNDAAKKSTDGLAVSGGKELLFSLYARAADFKGPLTVSIEKQDGTVLASQNIGGVGAAWKKFEARLTPSATDPNARLVVSTTTPGTLWLDMVSLFPRDTFKGRPNGIRADLAQMIADTHPAFLRFPGGSYVEGASLKDAYHWKETIGDVAQRPGHWNIWGYRSTDGLGFHEYLQLCEDLEAVPLYVANCGMAERDFVPLDQLEPWIQEALDAIEYANGPVTSKWGAERTKNGHPAPFGLKYLEIGNENGLAFSWGGGKRSDYLPRYKAFYDAVKAKYPDIITIANIDTEPDVLAEVVDEHYYNSTQWFQDQATRYDSYDRQKRPLYIGEFAVTANAGGGNLSAALGEAAFMTGLERNGDVVRMSSYAPLFVRPAWRKWNPNAIVFDGARAYGTPSYYVQSMFAANRGDVVLPVTIQQDTNAVFPGQIGIGTWGSQAEFKDIQVTKGGQTLFQSDLAKALGGGKAVRGQWSVADGVLRQSSNENDARLVFGDPSWSDYTLSLKARKTGGNEGFLISFQLPDEKAKSYWNLGGWGNTKYGLEMPGVEAPQVGGKIETGRWYDIRIELKGSSIRCYLDGQLIHDVTRATTPTLFAVAGKQDKGGEIVLKVVNTATTPTQATLQLRGAGTVAPAAQSWVLSSASASDENSFDAPTKVAPRQENLSNAGAQFEHVFPANSVTVVRLKTAK